MGRLDLHTHSTASDGALSPTELVEKAAGEGITVLALTDHDTMAGVPEATAAAETAGIHLIPGVELNTDAPRGELHILGYLLPLGGTEFEKLLLERQHRRHHRAHKMVQKLHSLGVSIGMEAVERFADGGVIGRPHIAQALVEAGHVKTVKEAFERYIGSDGPGYVKREGFTAAEAVRAILDAGGVPVLAHPGRMADEAYIWPLIEAGLQGIECHYPEHNEQQTARYVALARAHDLVITGGSDFHGHILTSPRQLGSVPVPAEAAEQLYERQRRLGRYAG